MLVFRADQVLPSRPLCSHGPRPNTWLQGPNSELGSLPEFPKPLPERLEASEYGLLGFPTETLIPCAPWEKGILS